MNKFRYEIYDYSKVGVEKRQGLYRKVLSFSEWSSIINLGFDPDSAAETFYKQTKAYVFKNNPKLENDPNIDWTWEIIAPNKKYIFK